MVRVRGRFLGVALAAAAAMALVACGGDDDSADDTAPVATQSGGSATSSSGTSKVTEIPSGAPFVDQDDLAFKPTKLTVKSGETVYFKNSEAAIHTVTINKQNVSGNMKKGEIITWKAPAAGDYAVTCDYHPQMKATITVQ